MTSPVPRRLGERCVALAVAAQLAAAVTGAVALQPAPGAPVRGDRASTRAATAHTGTAHTADADRTAAVRQLLAIRAAAVLHRDRKAFLGTVDPSATGLLASQGRVFDALGPVPLASWRYEVDPTEERAHTAALDARRGVWWAPDVTLHYALTGFDTSPTVQPQGVTFVEREGHWYLGADDDFATSGHPTVRDIWDGGPVVQARGASCLVLGHPKSAALVRDLAAECDAAVPRATAVWGRGWTQRVVVLMPAGERELATIVPDAGDLSQIAALATAELLTSTPGYHPVGDRVVINPRAFAALGPLGRRVVLTHEVTHVASRTATGPQVPTWFVEGLADYVGYRGAEVPLTLSAEELRADVQRGRLPRRLPLDGDFDGKRQDLAQSYEMSWLAVVLMSRTYGQAAVLQVYRDTGADQRAGALDRAMRKDLHVTLARFTQQWRTSLRAELS